MSSKSLPSTSTPLPINSRPTPSPSHPPPSSYSPHRDFSLSLMRAKYIQNYPPLHLHTRSVLNVQRQRPPLPPSTFLPSDGSTLPFPNRNLPPLASHIPQRPPQTPFLPWHTCGLRFSDSRHIPLLAVGSKRRRASDLAGFWWYMTRMGLESHHVQPMILPPLRSFRAGVDPQYERTGKLLIQALRGDIQLLILTLLKSELDAKVEIWSS
ncbi:uncharacterized protein LACBIDRAFT_328260 [Laccaria bicolor S238N-H82]|uniref:Predicted protein n=1 Tax=Laccaria bicolor (strain S238N-H82 / ATCC MYA-4686) TaxID=486041 RepID=B0DEC3_LACBS|nr:uncharacterized protein LACBIDRAFT_328260 [Laccaria bicolor S238N-H82]EDR07012.1 predicted protein [Laccaria bicolor S238N-H82]|eukprot:XP_001882385.1 predicted protein [Laccaria bicolor S238N-H82]